MKRWKASLFRGCPRRRSTCCQCAIIKSEYVKLVMHKNTMLIFFVQYKTEILLFFDTWLYYCCYVIIKIYHHDITILKAQNKNLVLQKKTLCWQTCRKQFIMHEKVLLVDQNKVSCQKQTNKHTKTTTTITRTTTKQVSTGRWNVSCPKMLLFLSWTAPHT